MGAAGPFIVRAEALAVGPGVAATFDTLNRMRRLVRSSSAQPIVRWTAQHIVAGQGPRVADQVAALREWLAGNVEFLRDPRGVEHLTAPADLLAEGYQRGLMQGDCDDIAMLGAALGMAIGLPARFYVVGRQRYEHVFTALGTPDGSEWWQLDTSAGAQGMDPVYLTLPPLKVEV